MLVNNASTFYPTPVGEITEDHWNDLLGTNLRAPLFLAQAAAPALRLTHGLILNIADIHGMRPLRRYTTYSVAKAGLIMLTKSLARELAPHVRVNAIAPGPVMWPEDGTDKALQKKIVDRTLLKRAGLARKTWRARRCSSAPRRRTSPARFSRWTAAAAWAGKAHARHARHRMRGSIEALPQLADRRARGRMLQLRREIRQRAEHEGALQQIRPRQLQPGSSQTRSP